MSQQLGAGLAGPVTYAPAAASTLAGGVGGMVGSLFGGQNGYTSQAQAADPSLYQTPNYAQNQSMFGSMFNNANTAAPTMQAAQMAGPSTTQDNQALAQQNALASQLQATAAGQGPSVASQQLQQGLQQQLAQQMAAASSMTGNTNPFLAQRQASNQAAAAMQATNQQTAQERAQEQLNAQNSLGSLLSNVRGQDQSMAGLQQNAAATNAQLAQQAATNNQGANIQQQQINNQMAQYGATGLAQLSQNQSLANQALGQAQLQASVTNANNNTQISDQNAQDAAKYGSGILGSIGSGLGSLF